MILRHVLATAFLLLASLAAGAVRAEPRLALVIGQGAYAAGELPTAVNDAALVGQTLTSAGFEVVQGRDLNQGDLRRIIRDFLDGVQTATPDTTVETTIRVMSRWLKEGLLEDDGARLALTDTEALRALAEGEDR